MSKPDITVDELRRLFTYDAKAGTFIRRIRMGSAYPAGQIAGSRGPRQYTSLGVNGKSYLAHRLAWLYMTGEWPSGHIDHIDGNTENNRFANLRDVSRELNLQNQKSCHKGNKSGYLGVFPNGRGWSAQITVAGDQRHLGTYPTPQRAHEVYLAAKRADHATCTI